MRYEITNGNFQREEADRLSPPFKHAFFDGHSIGYLHYVVLHT